ncbi:MAG TPA: BatD family protein [Polyangia bacterium]
MQRPPFRRRSAYVGLAATLAAALTAAAGADARAEAPRFQGEVDRNQVTVGEPFIYQVTVSVGNDQVTDYRPPDFKGLRVLSAPRAPNQSTQMQFGGAGMYVEVNYSWRYELAATQKGNVAIGPARIKVNGQEFRSTVVTVAVGAAGGPPPSPPPVAGPPSPAPASGAVAPPSSGVVPAGGGSFIRLVTDKQKAYVGEAISATWFLYMNQSHNKYDVQKEPTMEGFWTEDVTLPSRRGGMILNEELVQGRPYQVGAAMKKALFPLHAGRLSITPMEAQLSRVDFFGTAVRSQRVTSSPVEIEVLPLPKDGQPPGFDPANVGTFTIATKVDRPQVATGEAVTLTVEIAGHGNVRKVALPAVPDLDGWKKYDPRVNVTIDPATGADGTKVAEILLLPARPGRFTVPALTLDTFDPAIGRYRHAVTDPIELTVTGAALAGAGDGPGPGGPGAAPAAGSGSGSSVDNVIASEIRPIHARAELRRDLGATFWRTRAFLGVVVGPPLLFGLVVVGLRVRDRRARDTDAIRRRRSREKVRAHFAAAEGHRRNRQVAAFYIEIERVLREALSHRLGVAAAGLTMDDVRARAGELGLTSADADKLVAALEECDRARFAPGSVPSDDAALGAALDRAAELAAQIEAERSRRANA